MRDQNTEDGELGHDYSPNQLARLSIDNPQLYRRVVESNLEDDDTVDDWEARNLENAKRHLSNHYPLEGLEGQ
jgi:hypothetical protein